MKKNSKKQQKLPVAQSDRNYISKNHFIFPLLISITFCWSAFSKDENSAPHSIYLGVGEQRLVHFPQLKKFSIGKNELLRSLPLQNSQFKNTLLIKAMSEGYTDLTVWNKDGSIEKRNIYIFEWNKKHLPHELLPLLNTLEHTELIPFQKKILLRGTLHQLSELTKIKDIKKAFPNFIHDETLPSNALVEKGFFLLQTWLEKNKELFLYKLEKTNQNIYLNIQPKDNKLAGTLRNEIESIYPPTHIEMDDSAPHYPSIHFQVFLIEIQKNFMQSLGIQWPESLNVTALKTPLFLAFPESLELSLQHLESQGSLQILSQPHLVVQSPGEAELFSGGEIPLHLKSRTQSHIQWKTFGMSLKLKVKNANFFGVQIEIETEISSLDKSISYSEIPGLQANRMKTNVESEFHKPLLLSGLLQQKNSIREQGLPFIKNIPLLGSLFQSSDFQQNKTELVAILIPQKKPKNISHKSIERMTPEGSIPSPRKWLDPADEEELQKSPHYPWNAFREKNE